jgi:glycosyltransferase involved in cell wall biosynthesis
MIFIVHSETAAGTIAQNLGASEYSYYFVLKEFRPVLEELGLVVAVGDPAHEVDRIWRGAARRGEDCLFLDFSPPHRGYVATSCPTIPVFAWEFDTLPSETWNEDPRHDWRHVLRRTGRAITHSAFAVATVRAAMGPDYDVVSLPAPVWDRFAPLYDPAAPGRKPAKTITVRGRIFDTAMLDLTPYTMASVRLNGPADIPEEAGERTDFQTLTLRGVIYTAVFCPLDGRKNWFDMVCGFCWALRDAADATLVLKLTHRDCDLAILAILGDLAKLPPFRCRVVLIDGYLPDGAYMDLVALSSYTVNTSTGEGQCLPLMEFLSAGKPAVAPVHTAMADYLNEENAFVVQSDYEPGIWPHDPRQAIRTRRHRLDFTSLLQAYGDSYAVASSDASRYALMAQTAHRRQRAHCSREVFIKGLQAFLAAELAPA